MEKESIFKKEKYESRNQHKLDKIKFSVENANITTKV